jgi:hypothetical protein
MWIFKGKNEGSNPKGGHTLTKEDREKSAYIRGLQKEIKGLQTILDMKDNRLDALSKELEQYQSQKQENMFIQLLEKFLTGEGGLPNKKTLLTNISNSTTPERGGSTPSLTDDKIKEFILNVPKDQIISLLNMGDGKAKETMRARFPQMPETVIDRGIQIAKEVYV